MSLTLLYYLFVGASAVFASMSTALSSGRNPVPMNSILVNQENLWNTRTHRFTQSGSKGLFWVGLIAGAPTRTAVEYLLLHQSSSPVGGITRTSTSHSAADTLSFELLVSLDPQETLHVSSRYELYSNTDLQSGITIFGLTDAMVKESLVAFSVARDATLSGYANPVRFNIELHNPGHIYDTTSYKFTAPSTGIYYFTFSVGVFSRRTADFILYKNNEAFVKLYRSRISHTGYDTMSRSILMPLQANDKVFIVNNRNQMAWSSQGLQTRFSGFKYEPRHGIRVSF